MTLRKKCQIFISSTYKDLVEERTEVVRACLEAGHIPVGMEMFSASDSDQWTVIQRTIKESDYYVVIVAQRYGSTIPSENGISYTEKEYDYAVSIGVPVLGFILDDDADWPSSRVDKGKNAKKLARFRNKVSSRVRSSWKDASDLRGKFAIALSKALVDFPRPGWVPASSGGEDIAIELARLSRENDELRTQLGTLEAADFENLLEQMRVLTWTDACVAGAAMPSLHYMFICYASRLRRGIAERDLGMAIRQRFFPDVHDFAYDQDRVAADMVKALDAFGLIDHEMRTESGYNLSLMNVSHWRLSSMGLNIYRALWRKGFNEQGGQSGDADLAGT